MLVLTFTTIVAVTGYPSDPHTDVEARPPWTHEAKTQTQSCGNCNYVTLGNGYRFCVRLCLSCKEYEYIKYKVDSFN